MPILCTSFLKETNIVNKSGSPGTYPNKDSQIEVWLLNEMFNIEILRNFWVLSIKMFTKSQEHEVVDNNTI
jgi:hypothetical protein